MESGDLESRVSALEEQVRDLTGRVQSTEQDAAAARVLAGAADRDVSEFRGELNEFRGEFTDFRRATTASFNALRQDFVDLRTHVDNGFTEMRGKFDAMAAGQQQIVDLLHAIVTDQGHSETTA